MSGPDDYPQIPSTVPPRPLPDFTYDSLKKGDRIGTGGDADVYRATIEINGEVHPVAVKEPRFEGTLHQQVFDRFQNEAETWAKLDDHGNIVTVYSWDTSPVPWLALEYMDGGTLVEKIGHIDIAEALWLSGRIAEGIRYGHRHGVAHLDIKPSNILLRETDTETWEYPKVTDWGLAKLLLEHSKSMEGVSPTYAAPEQFDADEFGAPDDITDIYQLGTVIYTLVAGEPPFSGPATSVMQSVLNDEPEPASTINPRVPSAVDEILQKALAKQKSERYQGVLPLLQDIDRLFEEQVSERAVDSAVISSSNGASPAQPSTQAGTDTATPAPQTGSKPDPQEQTDKTSSEAGQSRLTRRAALGILGVGAVGAGAFGVTGFGRDESPGTSIPESGSDSGDEPTEQAATEESSGGEPIALGSIFPITGTNNAYGGGHQRAFNLAVEEINNAGGILGGREVVAVNSDTEGSPSRSAQKFRTMINEEGIVGLVGPYSSGLGTTLAPIARDNRVMEISNGNTSPALAPAGVNEDNGVKYYGRTAPNDVQQALVVAGVLNQIIDADTASFLYVDNPYGQGLAEEASEVFSGETLNMVAYTQATNDYTSTLDAVFDGEPDAIGAVMYPRNGRTILRQWSQGGYGGQWVGAEAIWSPDMLSDLSDIVEGMYITSPQTANSETFQENMGGQQQITQFAPHAYDATYLMGLALEQGGEASGTAIGENVRSVSRPTGDGTEVSVAGFGDGKEALADGSPVNYEGASGSVDLNENLEPVVPYRIMRVSDGTAELNQEVPLSYFEGKI